MLKYIYSFKDLPTKDICGLSKSRLSHVYLMTPNFPSAINPGTNCDCTLSTSYEKGQILLRRIDMKVFQIIIFLLLIKN